MVTRGSHWMHQRFVENFLASSRSRDFGEAAREWKIERHGTSPTNLHCHLCNTSINFFVVLRNIVNDNRLTIGNDCYDKFIAFLKTGKVESQLPKRSEHVKAIRKHLQDTVPVMPRAKRNRTAVKTVLGWFGKQFEAKALPDDIVAIVETMKILGFAPSIEDADKIVAYYKTTRKFPLSNFIAEWELKRYGFDPLQEVTLDEFGEIQKRFEELEASAIFRARQAERERIAREEEKARSVWPETRMKVLSALGALNALFEKVREELPIPAEEMENEMVWLRKKVDALPAEYPGFNAQISVENYLYFSRQLVAEVERSLEAQRVKLERWLAAPSEELVVVPGISRYALRKENDRWIKISVSIYNKEDPPKPGMYEVRYLGSSPAGWRGETSQHFLIAKEVSDAAHLFCEIDITTESTKHEGAFVGWLNRKVAVPNWLITEPGRYLCFVMGEQEKYYRVWTIQKVG